MSYAIIRNVKYKRENLKGIYRHNERRNTNYSNKNIDKEKTPINYHIKECKGSYEKEFERIRKQYNLQGQIKRVSNIVCEYMITSDKSFFEHIGTQETQRFFEEAYSFAKQFKNLGEKNIICATVHMDEEVPHMHLVFIPVVTKETKQGEKIKKIACSEFWKERDSYRNLQDSFYEHMTQHGFDIERGQASETKHLSMQQYKKITNFEKIKELAQIQTDTIYVKDISDIKKITMDRDVKIEKEIISPLKSQISILKKENTELLKDIIKAQNIIKKADIYVKEIENIKNENFKIKLDNSHIKRENNKLLKIIEVSKNIIKTICHWVSKSLAIPFEKTIDTFEKENKIYIDPIMEMKRQEQKKERDLEIEL